MSVREMLKAYAGEAAACCGWLAYQEGKLECEPRVTLMPPWRDRMREFLPRIEALLDAAEMRHYQNQIDGIRGQLDWDRETTDGIRTRFRALREAIESQLSDRWLLLVPNERAESYKNPLAGWGRVPEMYRRTKPEIEEAGKCLALERGTACVFHLMRIAEVGLRVLAKRFGVRVVRNKPVEYAQWQDILVALRKQIDLLQGHSAGSRKDRRQTYYSEMHLDLRAIRDAWRNNVSHARGQFSPAKAEEIYGHVRELMLKLAERAP